MPFTPKFVDMVRNLTTSTGTGAVNPGSAVSGFTSLSAAVATGEQFYYCIQGVEKPAEREVGRGTMLVNGTIAREPISGALFNFSVGTKTIALVAAAEWFAKVEAGGSGAASVTMPGLAELGALPTTNGAAALLTAKGREGLFVFSTANLSAQVAADTRQGIYVAPSAAPTGASGAWVRQFSGPANVDWWGAVADDLGTLGAPAATDNADAFEGALATLKARANATLAIDKLCESLSFDGHYYTSRTINLKQALRLLGTATKYSMRTRIRFPINSDGIVVNDTTTFGSTVEAATTNAAGAMVDGIHLLGGGGTGGHGFRLRNRGSIRNGGARNFGGDGCHIFAWSGGGGNANTFGNANCFDLNDLWLFANGRHGVFVAGSEGNAGYGTGIDASFNGGYGILDASFLGSNFTNCHADNNGNRNYATNAGVTSGTEAYNGGWVRPNTRLIYAGNVWLCALGKEGVASTTQPGTDATVWIDLGAGAPAETATWVNGITVRPSGPYGACACDENGVLTGANANGRGMFVGVYAEGGQAPCQIRSAGAIEGFIDAVFHYGDGQWIRRGEGARQTYSGGLETKSGKWVARNGVMVMTGGGATVAVDSGLPAASFTRNAITGLTFRGGAGSGGDMAFITNAGTNIMTVLNADNTAYFEGPLAVFGGDLLVSATRVIKHSGLQVVGARQTGTAANATDLATAIALVNDLKVKLVAHGLVS